MKKTGLLFFPAFDWSLGDTHPEREERLLYTQEQLFEEGVMDLPQIKQYSPGLADLKDVLRTQGIFPTPETHDLDAHLIAAGSSIVLGEALMKGEIHNGFALVRPPGHHSGATVLGNRGFCTLNNEAILVNYLRTHYGLKKIAIIDTDVHHGDGTQDIFYNDPNVLFISMHQDGRTLYPGTGYLFEQGGPNAWKTTLNVPLPPGTGDEEIHYLLEDWIMPRIQEFQPEIIINSAGQDNHFTDPLASMAVTARGYGRINEIINPDLAVLEGGYSIEGALPYVNLAIVLALAGEDYSGVVEPQEPPNTSSNLSAFKGFLQQQKQQYQLVKPEWNIREEKHMPGGKWAYYSHSVYYDTEGFREIRKDWTRLCQHCGGTVFIESHHTLTGYESALIRIPFEACPQCSQAGYDLWESFVAGGITRKISILLQDQHQNKVQLWHKDKGVTTY